jgi:hypothetical protein
MVGVRCQQELTNHASTEQHRRKYHRSYDKLLYYMTTVLGLTSLSLLHVPFVRGAASIGTQVSNVQSEYGGLGLTVWSVNGEDLLRSLGTAGERIKDSGEPFVTTGDSRHHIGSVTKEYYSQCPVSWPFSLMTGRCVDGMLLYKRFRMPHKALRMQMLLSANW